MLADGLAQPLACRRDDALADFGIDAVANPRGELLGVVPTEVLREWSLGQGLVYRGVEPLADGFADTFPYRLGHPLMDGFGEALAQSLAGAIEVESVRSTLRLDECRADLLSQPLAKLIPYSLLDRVVQTIAYPFGHAFP